MCTRPFLWAKRDEFVSIMTKILLLGLLIDPKWPKLSQNGPQRPPPTTVYLWPVQLYIIWGYLGHLGLERGLKSAPKWFQLLAIGPQNGLKFALNSPKMTLKHPQQYSLVVVSSTVHYFVAVRSFLGAKCLLKSIWLRKFNLKSLISLKNVLKNTRFLNFNQP